MRPIKFEYQVLKGQYTAVALDASLKDFDFHPHLGPDGKMVMKREERTIKDCRHIDGCVYFHLGRVSDSVMVEKIELFQKLKAEKQGWKKSDGINPNDNKLLI